jgi:hypothetical protein
MPHFICVTCGTQFPEGAQPPATCPICEDERQYVPAGGQSWTEMAVLGRDHEIGWTEEADGLFSLKIRPAFAIAQRAFLILHPDGNILWDCVSLIDAATVRRIEGLGGLSSIAISHPHYYSCMAEWSAAFGGVPVHIHEDDAKWVQRDEGAVRFWSGERLALGAATVIRCGGHFAGASVLSCPGFRAGAARCSPATRSRSCPTGATSPSCIPTRTSFRSPRPRSAASWTPSAPSPSTPSTAPSREGRSRMTARRRWSARRSGI